MIWRHMVHKIQEMNIKKYIYPTILFICLVVITILAIPPGETEAQGETQNENTYYALAQYYRQQYSEIRTEHYNLEVDFALLDNAYITALQTIESIGKITQVVAPDPAQVTNLQGEVANLRVALQTMTDSSAVFEQRFYKSIVDYLQALKDIEKAKATYQALWDRLDEVTNHTDNTTTSNLTPEKRIHFYEMWNLWIKTVE